jgi:hypothetical protein
MVQCTKYPSTVAHHIMYLGPLGSIAQNVLERVTEYTEHSTNYCNFILFILESYEPFHILSVLFCNGKVMQYHKNKNHQLNQNFQHFKYILDSIYKN